MQFFNDEKPVHSLELLAQLLSQPVIDTEQAKKDLLEYSKGLKDGGQKGFGQVLQIIKSKLHQIGINLPAQFNNHVTPDAKEEPRVALKKLGDLILYSVQIFGRSDLAIDLLNRVKELITVNSQIVATSSVRKAFFEDLSKIPNPDPRSTSAMLREIHERMNQENAEAIHIAMELYPQIVMAR